MTIRERVEELEEEEGGFSMETFDAIERAITEAVREHNEECAAIVLDPNRRQEYVMMGPRALAVIGADIRARKP